MNETLGKRIAGNRKRLGITQDRLAEQLGVTAQAVSKWENDQSCPDIAILPKLAELFGITVDALLGISPPEAEEAVDAEVVDTPPNSGSGAVNFQLDSDGKWNIHWDSGRRGDLFLALWVLLVGGILLASTVWSWHIGFWEALWPSGLLVLGIFGLFRRFSVFSLACTLFGTYFLLDLLELLPFAFTREFLLPLFLLLFGLSLMLDAFRRPRKPRFTVTHDSPHAAHFNLSGKETSSCTLGENSFDSDISFGADTHFIQLPLLRRGCADVSFGESTVDLSECQQVASDCQVEADCSFGQLTLRIPSRFQVELDKSAAFGSIGITGHPDAQPQGIVHLDANASFGKIRIIYI